MNLDYFKIYPDVKDIEFATAGSACFDLRCYLNQKNVPTVPVYRNHDRVADRKQELTVKFDSIYLEPFDRVLVPTGLKFNIPEGYSVRIFPRSSTGLKYGLTLPNSVGIIDSDYTDPVGLIIHNTSGNIQQISHDDRFFQAELVKNVHTTLIQVTQDITPKPSRTGGFGSTGN